jgi:hypothetical protein
MASPGGIAMKNILFVLLLLSASAAFGQYGARSIDSQPQIYHPPEHQATASYSRLAGERSIVGGGNTAYAQGDRPFSDFPQMASVPLGDMARELKKQHARVKKARIIWEN